MKILYVCPFAHYAGHFPWAAVHETQALARAGVEVKLLTFRGVIDKAEVKVPQLTVRQHIRLAVPLYHVANLLRKCKGISFACMSLEYFLTLCVAIRLKQKLSCNIIHLRDGEPFLFLPHLLSLPLRGQNWAVSLIDINLVTLATHPSLLTDLRKSFRAFLYTLTIGILNSNLWRPVYRMSLSRNHFIFLTQNKEMKQSLESYMQGALVGKVFCLPPGIDDTERVISKEEARRYFGLPQDKPVFLSFGSLHTGKDVETIFRALKYMPDVFLLHGGDPVFRLNLPSPENLAEKYDMKDRAILRDYYIPEEEKPYYFLAADAIILSYTKQFLSTASLLWEACRFELPVIASDNGQLRELVETFRPGLVFAAQDPDSLRQAVSRFINLKPGEVRKLKENCRRFTNEFSMDKWAQKCLEIYDRLLADKS